MQPNKKIHIGTSGWSYKHWKGRFYPPQVKSSGYLSFYATHFSVTELNSSFYRLPNKETVEKWANMVPDGFLFCPKMSRFLTHMKKLREPREPLERFFGIFEHIKKHLGPVLIQLPASLHFHEDVVTTFYEILRNDFADYVFAMEVRHETWFSDSSIRLMKKYKITLVMAQSGSYPYYEELTAKNIFFRFHGPDELYASSYSADTLMMYAEKFAAWAKNGNTVWIFFNNDIHGYALENAEKLAEFTSKLLSDDI